VQERCLSAIEGDWNEDIRARKVPFAIEEKRKLNEEIDIRKQTTRKITNR